MITLFIVYLYCILDLDGIIRYKMRDPGAYLHRQLSGEVNGGCRATSGVLQTVTM
jgi:hypothetical protein